MLSVLEKIQYDLCLDLAKTAHEGQFRRDGVTPYFEHPLKVSQMVGIKGSCILMCAALLHDVMEDTGLTVNDLLKLGVWEDIVFTVSVLTKNCDDHYHTYLRRIYKSKYAGYAIPVKVADIVCNLTDAPTQKQIDKYTKALTFFANPGIVY